jgi:hypothetical protein
MIPPSQQLDGFLANVGVVPLAVHLPVVVALIAGSLLTLFGKKLLKPIYVLCVASALGLVTALLTPNFVSDTQFGIPSPAVGMVLGAGVGALLAVATFRFALGLTCAITFATVGLLGGLMYLSLVPDALPPLKDQRQAVVDSFHSELAAVPKDAALKEARELLDRTTKRLRGEPISSPDEIDTLEPPTAAARTRAFLDSVMLQLKSAWATLPGDSQLTTVACAACGAMLGFVLGVVAPLKASAALTSVAGSVICVAAGAWLLAAAGILQPTILARGPAIWLAMLTGVALAGFVYQLPKRPASSPQPQPAQG